MPLTTKKRNRKSVKAGHNHHRRKGYLHAQDEAYFSVKTENRARYTFEDVPGSGVVHAR